MFRYSESFRAMITPAHLRHSEAEDLLRALLEDADYLGWSGNVEDCAGPRVFVLLTLPIGVYDQLCDFGKETDDLEIDEDDDSDSDGAVDVEVCPATGRVIVHDGDAEEEQDTGRAPPDPVLDRIIADLDRRAAA